jgi:hypothetical protein
MVKPVELSRVVKNPTHDCNGTRENLMNGMTGWSYYFQLKNRMAGAQLHFFLEKTQVHIFLLRK